MNLFHPEPMQRVSLYFRFDDAPILSVVLAQTGVFEACSIDAEAEQFPERQGIAYRRIFNHTLSNWQKIVQFFELSNTQHKHSMCAINKTQLLNAESRLSEIWKQCLLFREQQHKLDKQLETNQRFFKILAHFNNLDIDLSVLKGNFNLLDVRLGIIPPNHLNRLKQALSLEGYYLSHYLEEAEKAHIIVAGIKTNKDSIQALLESAAFQMLSVPTEFSEHPRVVYRKLDAQRSVLIQQLEQLQKKYLKLQQNYQDELMQLAELLSLARPYAVLSQYMQRNGQLITIQGWVPSAQLSHLRHTLEESIIHPVVLKNRDPKPREYTQTPSYLKRPNWLKPFTMLVNNYGVPGYREFEPSWLFTLSYILMFGIMFGDVGHGFGIIIIALLIRAKWRNFFSFFLAIGLSSMLFGFLYGSVFAFEHLLPALWMSPMHDPMLMLTLALIWGVCFITMLSSLSIYNLLRRFALHEALFGSKGLAGLCLYLAILLGIYQLSWGQFDYLNLLSILIPLVFIAALKWHQGASHSIQLSERLLVVIIETYEVIISYLSNTISFLRVAAFTLNHSALAMALFTLAGMVGEAGQWLVIILGNLFILVLEGAIVGIQVLRLEYYEGFSRFFRGNGYTYEPLQLSTEELVNFKKI